MRSDRIFNDFIKYDDENSIDREENKMKMMGE